MWDSVALTLAGNNIGKVLQKKGTLILPPLSCKLKPRRPAAAARPHLSPFSFIPFQIVAVTPSWCCAQVIRAYALYRLWISGFLKDMCGAALMLTAFSQAPVSVVQPIAGCGLAILCVFSHVYLKEVMNGLDWVAITLAGLGTIGVGVWRRGAESGEDSSFQYTLASALHCHLVCSHSASIF